MKNFLKLAFAFVFGIAVTAAVMAPKSSHNDIAEVITAPIPTPAPVVVIVTPTPEPVMVEETVEVEETVAVVEEIAVAPVPEPTPEPVIEPTPTPKPKATPAPQTKQPETWWEDGTRYTIINGFKAEISPEGNIQLSYDDIENSPGRHIPGPFTGNGGN